MLARLDVAVLVVWDSSAPDEVVEAEVVEVLVSAAS